MSCAAGVGSSVIMCRPRVYEREYGLVEYAATTFEAVADKKSTNALHTARNMLRFSSSSGHW